VRFRAVEPLRKAAREENGILIVRKQGVARDDSRFDALLLVGNAQGGSRLPGDCILRRAALELLFASPARTTLPTAHFDRNKIHAISGTGH
jgi:hypothetical protein